MELGHLDLSCVICGGEIDPPLADPLLLVDAVNTPESLQRYGFLAHEKCLLAVAAPGMRLHVSERLRQARDSDSL